MTARWALGQAHCHRNCRNIENNPMQGCRRRALLERRLDTSGNSVAIFHYSEIAYATAVPASCINCRVEPHRMRAAAALDAHWKKLRLIPTSEHSEKHLNQNLRGVGVHHVHVDLKRLSQTATGSWSLTGGTILVSAEQNGAEPKRIYN